MFYAESYFYVELNSKHILLSSFYPKNAFLVGKNALLCLHWFLTNILGILHTIVFYILILQTNVKWLTWILIFVT